MEGLESAIVKRLRFQAEARFNSAATLADTSMLRIRWSELIDGLPYPMELSRDQVQVWQATVTGRPSAFGFLEQLLASDERARADRFHLERDRNAFVVSRGVLRRLLALYTGEPAERTRFLYGPQGKPSIDTTGRGLQFNVSHSGNTLLLAFGIGRAFGVDVECARNNVDFVALANFSFSTRERAAVLALDPQFRAGLFYEYWTCKEACIKVDGRGLSVPLDQFTIVESSRGPDWRAVDLAAEGVLNPELQICVLSTWTGHAAAVASTGSGWGVTPIKLVDDEGPDEDS